MQRGDTAFVILFATILVIGAALVVVGWRFAGGRAAEQGRQMEAVAGASRALLQLHYAMERAHIDALRDVDQDQRGEYLPLPELLVTDHLPGEWQVEEDVLQQGAYRYRAILPGEVDAAETTFAVVALPADPALPVFAIDERGDLRQAPEGFVPGTGAPVDPHTWPLRR